MKTQSPLLFMSKEQLKRIILFFGTSTAGGAALLGLKRVCFAEKYIDTSVMGGIKDSKKLQIGGIISFYE